MIRVVTVCILTLVSATVHFGEVGAAIPEPDAIFYGGGTSPLVAGDLVEAKRGSEVLSEYVVGSDPSAGDLYVLSVALETPVGEGDPPTPGVAQVGDEISLYLNGEDTGEDRIVSDRGMIERVDLPVDPDLGVAHPGDRVDAVAGSDLEPAPHQVEGDVVRRDRDAVAQAADRLREEFLATRPLPFASLSGERKPGGETSVSGRY